MASTLHDLTLAGQYADELVLPRAGGWSPRARPIALTVQTLAEHYQRVPR